MESEKATDHSRILFNNAEYPAGTDDFYKTLEDIFTEFVDIYEFDKGTAVLPKPFGSFRSAEHKQEWMENHLLAIEFDYHLGCILYNYHAWLVDEGHLPDIVLGRMVTDYPNVYQRVLYDYISVLKNMPPQYPFELGFHPLTDDAGPAREKVISELQREQLYQNNKPYFASFALPSLIEHFMISFMQQGLVTKLMKQLSEKCKNREIELSEDEKQFVNVILNPSQYMDGSREDTMRRCRDLFDRAGLILDGAEQIILGTFRNSPITLGQFLNNPYAKKHIKKPYYDVLDILFSSKKVNLRNSIMHGASITFDPYAMCFSAVMLQIFWAVIDRKVFEKI